MRHDVVAGLRGPARVWARGSASDAITMALALNHRRCSHRGGGEPKVYLTGDLRVESLHFTLADLRCVPRDEWSDFFERRESRYMPMQKLSQRVLLGRPEVPVDLVTMRSGAAADEENVAHSAAQLRKGGRLLLADGPREIPSDMLRPLDRLGRLYEKIGDTDAAQTHDVPDEPEFPTLAAKAAQQRLIEAHIGLAHSLARRFSHHGESRDDLVQVALLALVKAAGRFDPGRNTSFSTFATASIVGELKRHFRDKTWMLRVPRSLQETYLAVKDAREALNHQLGESPTVQQIASYLSITEDTVFAALEAADSYWPASLDAPRPGETSAREIPVVDPGFESALERRELQDCIPSLNAREQLLVKRLYFDGWTQRRVAKEIGVSQMQVSRLMAQTIERLRQSLAE